MRGGARGGPRGRTHTLPAGWLLPGGAGFHPERGGQVTVATRLSGGLRRKGRSGASGPQQAGALGRGGAVPKCLMEGGAMRPASSTYVRHISCLEKE